MTSKPKVSTVVLNWNAKEVLRECLESLQQSAFPLHRVIVVDNASADGSVEMVKDLFPNVTVIENSENLGAPGGRNVGLKAALQEQIDYLYTLDNDLIIEPSTIGELVRFMESHPEVGCTGSIIYYADRRDVIFNAGHYIDWSQNLVRSRGMNQRDKGQLEECGEVDYVGTGAMLTRSRVFQEIGFLDAGFIGYGYEDTDFGVRIRKRGYKVICYSRSKVWHRPFSGVGRYSFKKKYLESRNAIRFLRMYGTRRSWVTFSFYAIAGLGYAAIREGLRGNIMGVVGKAKGLYDGLRGKEEFAHSLLAKKS
jgi:GT2 family glycosyltransferase